MNNFYKVVDSLSKEITINTIDTNYSSTLSRYEEYWSLLETIVVTSRVSGFGFDFFYILHNNIALWGTDYFKDFPAATNSMYSLATITGNEKDNSKIISEQNLYDICESLVDLGAPALHEGYYLWEHLYDDIRLEKYEDLPKRLESFFLFANIADCEYYITKHKGGGTICEVELVDTETIFKGDMTLLDGIPNDANYNEASEIIDFYWSGKTSKSPVFEYVFQGTCKLKPLA